MTVDKGPVCCVVLLTNFLHVIVAIYVIYDMIIDKPVRIYCFSLDLFKEIFIS